MTPKDQTFDLKYSSHILRDLQKGQNKPVSIPPPPPFPLHHSKQMNPEKSNRRSFRLRSILIFSLSSTVLGIIIFRLATANTQNVVYVKMFATVGVILATGPWIIQLLLSTITMVLYKAGIHDLTSLLMLPSDEAAYCCQDYDLKRMVDGHARRNTSIGFGTIVPVNVRGGPQLQRNRTI